MFVCCLFAFFCGFFVVGFFLGEGVFFFLLSFRNYISDACLTVDKRMCRKTILNIGVLLNLAGECEGWLMMPT